MTWMIWTTAALAIDVTVGPGGTVDDFEELVSGYADETDLVVRLLDDVVVDSTAVFTVPQSVRFESSVTGPYRIVAAQSLAPGAPMVATNGVGSVTFAGVGLVRASNTPGVAVEVAGGELELSDVFIDDAYGAQGPFIDATGAVSVERVSVCGGRYDAGVLRAGGVLTFVDSVWEGLTGAGPAVDAPGSGSLSHVTIAGLSLGIGLRVGDGDVAVDDSVIDAQTAVTVDGAAYVTPTRSGFRGATVGLFAPGIDLSVDPFLRIDDGGHCGFDARPDPSSPLWDSSGAHIGGYHGLLPVEGWDDDDGDGVGYGEDCADDDPSTYPGAVEACTPDDLDCDGFPYGGNLPVGTGVEAWPDADDDGLGDYFAESTRFCDGRIEAGWVDNDDDCDDTAYGAFEEVFYQDADSDGFPNELATTVGCEAVVGYAEARADGRWDCDDGRAQVNPDEAEDCDEPDQDTDCDGLLPADEPECQLDETSTTDEPTTGDDTDGPTTAGGGATAGQAGKGCACEHRGGAAGWLALIAALGVRRARARRCGLAAGRR
jgi:hypothetical protein